MECREIVDSAKESPIELSGCKDCDKLQILFNENPGGKPIRRTGLILAAIVGGTGIAISTICIPFVTPALRRICLPYVPATTIQLENIQRALKTFAHKKSGNKLVDIGSGDGRIVHLAAQNGYKAHGIELNPWLVLYSKYRSLRLGIRSTATFSRQDLWKSNFDTYDSIVIFGVEQMMNDLENKLSQEIKPECTVVACRFPFPNWKEIATIGEGVDSVWVYKPGQRIPEMKRGSSIKITLKERPTRKPK